MSQVSPAGRGAVTAAAATGLVVPAAGVCVPVVSPNADHQPWRLPWATFWLNPSSKSATTSVLAGAPQARLLVPPAPVLPPVALPPVPVPLPPVPVLPPVPLPPTQARLVQVCPEPHLLPQVPQLEVVVTSTQAPLQRLWLDEPQLQLPFTQVVPPVQALPQVPQSAEFVLELQAPSEHLVPEVQVDEQVPSLLQTSVPEQVLQLEPQCWAFEATHEPPQETKPLVQLHVPF